MQAIYRLANKVDTKNYYGKSILTNITAKADANRYTISQVRIIVGSHMRTYRLKKIKLYDFYLRRLLIQI